MKNQKHYQLVTGFYPSIATAEKILKKVKSKYANASVKPFEDCYIVIVGESDNYDEIDNLFSECMKNKIYCGIMVNE